MLPPPRPVGRNPLPGLFGALGVDVRDVEDARAPSSAVDTYVPMDASTRKGKQRAAQQERLRLRKESAKFWGKGGEHGMRVGGPKGPSIEQNQQYPQPVIHAAFSLFSLGAQVPPEGLATCGETPSAPQGLLFDCHASSDHRQCYTGEVQATEQSSTAQEP